MPGATLLDMDSMSSEPDLLLAVLDLFWSDFLAGVTVKSLESGGMILMDRATLSLFLKIGYKFYSNAVIKI
jgi:hypothetical protein